MLVNTFTFPVKYINIILDLGHLRWQLNCAGTQYCLYKIHILYKELVVWINIKDKIWKDNNGISDRKQKTQYQSEVQLVILAQQKLKGCDIL